MTPPVDSLIFDMDGTLWDAVDSYCAVWNETYRRLDAPHTLSREQLLVCMGLPLAEIYRRVSPDSSIPLSRFMPLLREVEKELMPKLGGRLYPGVKQTLTELKHRGYKLFMVSNCSPNGLSNFMHFTGLGHLFTDSLSYGQTGLDKDGNISALVKRYSLERPVYVGDIEADCTSAHAASVEMLWVSYGFGQCVNADMQADSISQLLEMFPPLN